MGDGVLQEMNLGSNSESTCPLLSITLVFPAVVYRCFFAVEPV